MEPLDDLERAVLEMLVAGDAPSTRRLQEQFAACRVGARERTGVGGAGFLLTIADGYLDELEGYSYDEPWPGEIVSFTLSYTEEPRDLTALTPP
jgi:hypothetical protein